jgi:hypothetical protein
MFGKERTFMCSRIILRRISPLLAAGLIIAAMASLFPDAQAQQNQQFRMAIIGLVHSHAWGHLRTIAKNANVEKGAPVSLPF